jgi:hypothetical protein
VPPILSVLRNHRAAVLGVCVVAIALLLALADLPRTATVALVLAGGIAVVWITIDVVQAAGRDRGKHDRDLLAFATAGLLVGLVGLSIAGWWASSVDALLERTVTTSGSVIDHHSWTVRAGFTRRSSRRKTVYGPVVRFLLPGGEAVVFKSQDADDARFHGIGETLEVHYDPAEPQRSAWTGPRGDAWAGPRLVAYVGGGFALAGAWGIALFVRRGPRRGPCRS